MDRIDALGESHRIDPVLSRALLAETEDRELQNVVERAARDLSAPIALVNLVLDQVQYFKTHYGLPSDLAAARGTDRDVSFCQFVVKSGEPFEVTDAERDQRIPQHLVRNYNLKSYLGMPVAIGAEVVGSLCVIDTQAREFSDEERNLLKELSALVSRRLAELSDKRRNVWSGLVHQTSAPALAELRSCLAPMQSALASGSAAAIQSGPALRLASHMLAEGTPSMDTLRRAVDTALRAITICQGSFDDIEAGVGDVGDSLTALEHALTSGSVATLSTIAESGRELARQSVALVGGVALEEVIEDPVVSTPRPLGVALVATCLSMAAAMMAGNQRTGGLRMRAQVVDHHAEIGISSVDPRGIPYDTLAAQLMGHAGQEPTVDIHAADDAIVLRFSVPQTA